MENTKIMSAEEFLYRNYTNYPWIQQAMIEFAKLHVSRALEEAYLNAETKEEEVGDKQICWSTNDYGDTYVLDKNSIINAYPLENIK